MIQEEHFDLGKGCKAVLKIKKGLFRREVIYDLSRCKKGRNEIFKKMMEVVDRKLKGKEYEFTIEGLGLIKFRLTYRRSS
ncbi:MAG: hypothetical protein ACXQTS_01400 [Candidatus Methanospirareceae archaeon]